MRLSEVKKQLKESGRLDERELVSYANLAGTIHGEAFQNIVAAIFEEKVVTLYRCSIDGSIGDMLVSVPYEAMTKFKLNHRFLYAFTEFSADSGTYRFYSYDKKVFLRGFQDAGLVEARK